MKSNRTHLACSLFALFSLYPLILSIDRFRPLEIQKLQDYNGNDLDLGYHVSEVFDDKTDDNVNSIVRVLQKPSGPRRWRGSSTVPLSANSSERRGNIHEQDQRAEYTQRSNVGKRAGQDVDTNQRTRTAPEPRITRSASKKRTLRSPSPEDPVTVPKPTTPTPKKTISMPKGPKARRKVSYSNNQLEISTPAPKGEQQQPARPLGTKVTPIPPPEFYPKPKQLLAEAVVLKPRGEAAQKRRR